MATASVDGITCGYALRNFTELQAVFDEFGRVVRPGGRISLLEVAEPDHGLLLVGHRIWFRRVVPVIGGLVSDRAAYRYLPAFDGLPPADGGAPVHADDAGFSAVNQRPLSGGLSQLITATRSGTTVTGRPSGPTPDSGRGRRWWPSDCRSTPGPAIDPSPWPEPTGIVFQSAQRMMVGLGVRPDPRRSPTG